MDKNPIDKGVAQLFSLVPHEAVEEEWRQNTPRRVVDAFQQMTEGYRTSPSSILDKKFELGEAADQIVLIKDLPFTSLCAHHLLPFHGVAHIAYVPSRYNVGLSKIPRLLRCRSRRLQLQETLGHDLATDIQSALDPIGVAVILSSTHDCMSCRGVESLGRMVTSKLLGVFKDDMKARDELMFLIEKVE